jgi:Zn-dependent M16 (insulinase) family peptidase
MGAITFYTYRDPHLDSSLDTFNKAAQWLEKAAFNEEDLEGFVVSTVAALDNPLKPRAIIKRQDADVFSGRTWDDYLNIRTQLINSDLTKVQSVIPALKEASSQDIRCVFGNKDIIEASNRTWTVVDLMNE